MIPNPLPPEPWQDFALYFLFFALGVCSGLILAFTIPH
jgi:hypothetical protein